MLVLLDKQEEQRQTNSCLGGWEYPPLSAYCIRGAELTEPELLLALRWLALPFELRQASLDHVQGRADDDR